MKSELLANETVVREGAANLQKGIEAVGGKLWLTNQRLVFESHALNVQSGITEINLSDVKMVRPCWTKFLNLIPLFPNSLRIETADGKHHQLVLFGRSKWKSAIDDLVANPAG